MLRQLCNRYWSFNDNNTERKRSLNNLRSGSYIEKTYKCELRKCELASNVIEMGCKAFIHGIPGLVKAIPKIVIDTASKSLKCREIEEKLNKIEIEHETLIIKCMSKEISFEECLEKERKLTEQKTMLEEEARQIGCVCTNLKTGEKIGDTSSCINKIAMATTRCIASPIIDEMLDRIIHFQHIGNIVLERVVSLTDLSY